KSLTRPWYQHPLEKVARHGAFGEIMPEDEFYGVLSIADNFDLVWLEESFVRELRPKLTAHPLLNAGDLKKLGEGKPPERIAQQLSKSGAAIPLYLGPQRLVGCFLSGHDEDPALEAPRLLENLACKAIAALSLRNLHTASGIPEQEIDFILGSGEEAIGDR